MTVDQLYQKAADLRNGIAKIERTPADRRSPKQREALKAKRQQLKGVAVEIRNRVKQLELF